MKAMMDEGSSSRMMTFESAKTVSERDEKMDLEVG